MAIKYTLMSCDEEAGESYGYPKTRVQVEFKADHLDDVINGITQFLVGTGFVLRGKLELVEDLQDDRQLPLQGFDLSESK